MTNVINYLTILTLDQKKKERLTNNSRSFKKHKVV